MDSLVWRNASVICSLLTKRRLTLEDTLLEPVELTEDEIEEVAGGGRDHEGCGCGGGLPVIAIGIGIAVGVGVVL
jgi:hypothetical protein